MMAQEARPLRCDVWKLTICGMKPAGLLAGLWILGAGLTSAMAADPVRLALLSE